VRHLEYSTRTGQKTYKREHLSAPPQARNDDKGVYEKEKFKVPVPNGFFGHEFSFKLEMAFLLPK
jgi:hypothetical protein